MTGGQGFEQGYDKAVLILKMVMSSYHGTRSTSTCQWRLVEGVPAGRQ
jgi:hypothetical protein